MANSDLTTPNAIQSRLFSQAQQCFEDFKASVNSQQTSDSAEKFDAIDENNSPFAQKLIYTFAHSDFLQRIALQYPLPFLDAIFTIYHRFVSPSDSETIIDDNTKLSEYFDSYSVQINEKTATISIESNTLVTVEKELGRIIRQFRQIKMAEIAFLDMLKAQSIESSLRAVSSLADCIITQSYECLYKAFCKRYGTPDKAQDMLILGMGKLGGNELNFSSDIDLIFTYPKNGETDGKKPLEHQVFFTRLAQKLINVLDQITQDGRAYRVDMRLRPLGESGPLVLPFSAFETYYQEQGREWERFAMQKMRIINTTAHNTLLSNIIRPFVYRKYVDFTSIESIREMKTLIEKEVRRRQISNNIKLGRGGIREAEFFVQSIQLIHAGRHPECQLTSILSSMDIIESLNLQSEADIHQLRADYLYLRKVEHYLQAFNDEQTQTLPDEALDQYRLASLLGAENYEQAQNGITQVMARIHEVFKGIFDDPNEQVHESELLNAVDISEQSTELENLLEDIWQLNMTEEEALSALEEIDEHTLFVDRASFIQLIFGFKKKTDRSNVSARARKSINKLMPLVLQELGLHQYAPEDDHTQHSATSNSQIKAVTQSLSGIFDILQTICTRVTYLDLLIEHPEVRLRLFFLCTKSPWIAQQIAHYPILLDELLYPQYLNKEQQTLDQYRESCTNQLAQTLLRVDPEDEERVLETLREFKLSNQLRIAAADISGSLVINRVSDKLTILAEVIVQKVVELTWVYTCKLFGKPSQSTANIESINSPSDNFALIAYGKFGGIELSYGSDLDLVFLHSADLSGTTDSSGSRQSISNQAFFIKLVQKIFHICTTKSYSGILYDIDLRLRPSGNSGLLISHIDSFLNYQLEEAWTWEHQALVRSRMILGAPSIQADFSSLRKQVLCLKRDASSLKQEVFEMREKMRTHLLKPNEVNIDLKQCNGGIVDLEFLVQFWILAHANEFPQIVDYSDNLRLIENLMLLGIIDQATAKTMTDAYLFMRHLAHRLQLSGQQVPVNNDDMHLQVALENISQLYREVFES